MNKVEQFLNDLMTRDELSRSLERQFSNIAKSDLNELIAMNEYYKNKEMSYVYFLKNLNTGLTKIGATGNLSTRVKNIVSSIENNIGVAHEFVLTFLVPVNSSQLDLVEKYFHSEYKECRKFGEWFDLDSEVDMINFVDDFICIDNTLIVLDNSFDRYPNYNLSYDITNDDRRDFFNIPVNSKWYKTSNKYLDVYKTCRDSNINFRLEKLILKKNKLEKVFTDIFTNEDSRLYTISKLKKEKLNKKEIEQINKWLTQRSQ